MGLCASREATKLAIGGLVHQTTSNKHVNKNKSPEDETKPPSLKSNSSLTKGVTSSFGFKRRQIITTPTATGNPTAARRLANIPPSTDNIDNNGNNSDTTPLASNAAPTGRSTPHRLQPPKKEAAGNKTSRFGFRQPNTNRLHKVADMNTTNPVRMEFNNNKDVNKDIKEAIKAKVETCIKPFESNRFAKVTLQSSKYSNLPKPVMPIKFTESTKSEKTNNNRKLQSLIPASGDELTEDSGVGSNYGDNIQQLDRSPLFTRRRNNINDEIRPILQQKMVDSNFTNPANITLPKLPPIPPSTCFLKNSERFRKHSSTSSESSSIDEKKEKPKLFLKSRLKEVESSSDDQLWITAGEAMAEESGYTISSSDECKDVLQGLINFQPFQDFNVSEMSNSNLKSATSSPDSPTNASLSLSDHRDDFLIDDEIADQPGLICDDTITNSESNLTTEITPTIVDSTPKTKRKIFEGSPSMNLRNKRLTNNSSTVSLNTLSPCESIASDDCMMDFEMSCNSEVDDIINNRADKNKTLDDDFDIKANDVVRDWTSLLEKCDISYNRDCNKRLSRQSRLLRSRAGTPSSASNSPKSSEGLRSRASSMQSPLRLSSRSSGTAEYESDDSVIKVDKMQHCAMQQDVMGIKTMLIKLKRIIQESETHNSLENGFFNGFISDYEKISDDHEPLRHGEVSDLKRQLLFLQGQLEDKERMVTNLQEQMVRLITEQENSQSAPASVSSLTVTSNAATQTERIRPISAGPALLQSTSPNATNAGSLVSASESKKALQKSSTSGRLWRTPGEPASPQRFGLSSPTIGQRRSSSRSRATHS